MIEESEIRRNRKEESRMRNCIKRRMIIEERMWLLVKIGEILMDGRGIGFMDKVIKRIVEKMGEVVVEKEREEEESKKEVVRIEIVEGK